MPELARGALLKISYDGLELFVEVGAVSQLPDARRAVSGSNATTATTNLLRQLEDLLRAYGRVVEIILDIESDDVHRPALGLLALGELFCFRPTKR